MLYKQNLRNENNNYVKIIKDGIVIKELSLSDDQIFEIDEHAVVEIRAGKIRMKKSDCPGQHCVKQGWSSQVPIICVPHKLVIQFDKKKI